jgi:hypothetical protein
MTSTVVNHATKIAETALPNVEEVDNRSSNDHKPIQFKIDDQSDRVSTNPMPNVDNLLNGDKNQTSNGEKIPNNQIPVHVLTNGDRALRSQNEKRVSMSNGENRQKLSTTSGGDVDEIQSEQLTNGELSKSVESSRFVPKVSELFNSRIIF